MSGRSVRVNSGDVRTFAHQLNQFNSELVDSSSRLIAQFGRLGETWSDPEYAKFAAEFEQTMSNLRRFRDAASEVTPRLLNLANVVDQAKY